MGRVLTLARLRSARTRAASQASASAEAGVTVERFTAEGRTRRL
jgi:hypothetical protein